MIAVARNKSAWVHAWDFLAWILVVFPLLTGGIWIRHNGHFIELAELGIPVLIVSILAILLTSVKRLDLTQATSVRAASALWTKWNEYLDDRPRSTLTASAVVMAAIFALSALRRHWAYGTGAADLGIFTSAIWNLTNGLGYVSSLKGGMNLFADHQSPIFWAFAPAFRLFPRPETLLILQSIGLSTGGIAIYFLGRQYLVTERAWAAALPILYWAYLPLRNANSFDFHPETMMLPLFLWALLGLQGTSLRARALGLIALLLGMGAKESSGPVAVGVGIAWILGAGPAQTRSFCRKLGVATIALGLAVFYVDTRIIPQSLGYAYPYDANYDQYGGGVSSLILAPFLKPGVFWPHVFGRARLQFLLWTLGPLAFLPLLGWRAAIASVPAYAILFLSEGDHRVNLKYHYSIEPSIGLFWSLGPALLAVSQMPPAKKNQIALAMIFFALVFFGRSEFFRSRIYSPTPHQEWLTQKLIPCLSAEASFAVSGSMVPHVAMRPWANHLPQLEMPAGKRVDCAIFDSAINNWPMDTDQFNHMDSIVKAQGFQMVFQCGSSAVYERSGDVEKCLRCMPDCGALK